MTIWQSFLTVAAFAVVQLLVTLVIGRFMRSRNLSIKYPDYVTYRRPEPVRRRGVGDLPGREGAVVLNAKQTTE